MARTKAASGYGVQLLVGDANPAVSYAALGEVVGVSGPETMLETDDATHAGSDGAWAEHVATILRAGDVTLDINWVGDASDVDDLRTRQTNRELWPFKVKWPQGGGSAQHEASFQAFVTSIAPDAQFSSTMRARVSLKISGAVTKAVAA